MGMEESASRQSSLELLQKEEAKLWRGIEFELARGAMALINVTTSPKGTEVHDAVEQHRASMGKIADAIRRLTQLIRLEIKITEPNMGTDELAERIDKRLEEKIKIIFYTDETPNPEGSAPLSSTT